MNRIRLTQGRYALVDDEDLAYLMQFRWCASLESRGTKWYAIRWKVINGKKTKIRMHHVVMGIAPGGLPEGYVVDHVNGNGLDNRKTIEGKPQLEIITQTENMNRCANWKRKKVEPFL